MTELYSLHQITVQAADEPLHAVLAANVEGLSKQRARQAIVAGLVTVDGGLETKPTNTLPDKSVQISLDLRHGIKKSKPGAAEQRQHDEPAFKIIYEDDDVVVVNKAAGIMSAPTQRDDHGHVPELLRNYWRKQKRKVPYIGVVHRIDQATSGCLLFALNKGAQHILSQQFNTHAAKRMYRCLCLNQPFKDEDTLEAKIGRGLDGRRKAVDEEDLGKSATTHFKVRQRIKQYASELDVELETGRTHQIRVHLSGIGCPILGDDVYSKRAEKSGQLKGVSKAPRLMLHAHQISFDHPKTGERISADAPFPAVYEKYLKQLLRSGPIKT
jgi:23S rRNA pseudouridine1911/1915/1917 synthase